MEHAATTSLTKHAKALTIPFNAPDAGHHAFRLCSQHVLQGVAKFMEQGLNFPVHKCAGSAAT